MRLTEKDYELIIKAIKYEGRELNNLSYITGFNFTEARDAIRRIIMSLAIIFAGSNPYFDEQKFIESCKGD